MPPTQPLDIEATGARIERLLDRIAGECGDGAADLAEDLVRNLLTLYGAGLDRMLSVVRGKAADAEEVVRAFADDPLVAGLLALHDLHPVPVADRIAATLAHLRRTTGATVELLGVADDTVTVSVDVSGCASSAASLQQAVEATVQRVAPEVTRVVVERPAGPPGRLIPAESLLRRPGGFAT